MPRPATLNLLLTFLRTVPAIVLFFQSSIAQPFDLRFRPITVVDKGDTLLNPFSGGINNPIFQFLDIDADGDRDLFILDRDQRLTFYRNVALAGALEFELVSIGFGGLDVGSWFRFVDIDADGDYDLFCGAESFGVSFFRNRGNSSVAQFTEEVPVLMTTTNDVIVADQQSVHAFADIDGDGDLDFFSGNQLGTITFYRNTGTPALFQFEFVTDMFQGIIIVGGAGKSPVRFGSSGLPQQALHGAMAFEFADIDADGDLDLFWGDFFNQSLYYLQNIGTPTNPQIVLADSTFSDEATVLSNGFNMPSLLDIDSDGDLDLFIGVLYFGTSIDNFHFYRNVGSGVSHNFVLETKNLLPTIDVGATSIPLFTDLDGDGLRDLLVGGENASLTFFKRQETMFTRDTMPPINLAGLFNISPAASDLNGDGRIDLIIGDFNGNLRLYLRTDSGFVREVFSLDSETFGLNAAPALVDIDDDALTDLFVGTGGGRMAYYRNQGSATQPDFILQSSNYLAIDVGDEARPAFADMDGDGDRDLIIGAFDGSLTYFLNGGTTNSASFQLVPDFFSGVAVALRASPALEDLDGDEDPDLFLGNSKGGLYFYENRRGQAGPPSGATLIRNYPNPFRDLTVIRFLVPEFGMTTLKMYDVLGNEVATLLEQVMDPGIHSITLDAGVLSSGIYICRLRAGRYVESRKVVVIR